MHRRSEAPEVVCNRWFDIFFRMKPITKGDYVLATKYSDGDPSDHWAVGFFDCTQGNRHFIVGNDGQQLRANGFRRIGRITPEKGAWLLQNSCDIEMSGRSVWGFARRSLSNARGQTCGPADPEQKDGR